MGLGQGQDIVQIGQPCFRSGFEPYPGVFQRLAQGVKGQGAAKLMKEVIRFL
jgi:hypothetical protein